MEVKELTDFLNNKYWIDKINESDWGAGKYLYELITQNKFYEACGKISKILLLVEGKELISFCTLAEQDDVREKEMTPWIGFVYTFPQFRGKRRVGKLLEYAYKDAKNRKYRNLYISTNEQGLYEKYGYSFYTMMKDINGEDSRVYKIDIVDKDYSDVIGTMVKGTIDRPLGSCHPRHKELVYPINYGYVDGVFAGDGAEQDVYIIGVNKPLERYEGKVIAVYHRINDVEDKWIVTLDDRCYSDEEILNDISFQEQYFVGELYR